MTLSIEYEKYWRLLAAILSAAVLLLAGCQDRNIDSKQAGTREIAEAIAQAYRSNPESYSQAAARMAVREDTFDYADVRILLTAALESEATRETIDNVTQNEALRLLRADADFANPASGQAGNAGRLLAAYAHAYARSVLRLDKAQAVDEYRKQRGLAELLVLSAYDAAALDAVSNSNEQAVKKASEFRNSLIAYNALLPEGGKILDANNRLINRSQAVGAQLENLHALVNGQIASGILPEKKEQAQQAANAIHRLIKPSLDEVLAAMNDALQKP